MVFLKEIFEKVDFEKNQQTTKRHAKLPSLQRVNSCLAEFEYLCFANIADTDQTASSEAV